MEGGRAQGLKQQRLDMRAELASLGRDTKRAKRQAASTTAAASRAWVLKESVLRVVLIVQTLANGVVDPAVAFLMRKGRECHWPERSKEEIEDLVYATYASADVDAMAAMIDASAPTDAAALSIAVDCVEQWRVVLWAKAQNRIGVAPGTGAVLDELERRAARHPADVRPPPWGSSSSPTSRKRLSRWRRRWGGRLSKIRVREEIPLADMRSKAVRVVAPDVVAVSLSWGVTPPTPHPPSPSHPLSPCPPASHSPTRIPMRAIPAGPYHCEPYSVSFLGPKNGPVFRTRFQPQL
jgi:hypothetical protein